MGRRNSFAEKIVRASGTLRADERRAIVRKTTDTVFMIAANALHSEFGLGPESQERFRLAFEREALLYGDLMADVDVDYADGKLEQAYAKITKKKGISK